MIFVCLFVCYCSSIFYLHHLFPLYSQVDEHDFFFHHFETQTSYLDLFLNLTINLNFCFLKQLLFWVHVILIGISKSFAHLQTYDCSDCVFFCCILFCHFPAFIYYGLKLFSQAYCVLSIFLHNMSPDPLILCKCYAYSSSLIMNKFMYINKYTNIVCGVF